MTTIVLVHGAFAESSSWNAVIERLQAAGHTVIAYANPLRGIAIDAVGLTDLIATLTGPVVLVGHSYGGAVLTAVPSGTGDIRALVYVAAFALIPGESAGDASSAAPGSTLGETLQQVPLQTGGFDMYIDQSKYHQQFCADIDAAVAATMAATQRPVTAEGLNGPLGATALWQTVPSWFIFGELDRNIPVAAHHIMADRANARQTIEVPGASHVVGMSHPDKTADLILTAVAETVSI